VVNCFTPFGREKSSVCSLPAGSIQAGLVYLTQRNATIDHGNKRCELLSVCSLVYLTQLVHSKTK
ncbi:MAG: hypothetical protein AB7S69_01625, partial [Salinivirgaceae bacterium]